MAEQKKRKEKSLLDKVADKYNQVAKSGYLGARAQTSATAGSMSERAKKKKKRSY